MSADGFACLLPGGNTVLGVATIFGIFLTPDGRGYAYTHGRYLQDPFLVEGLPNEATDGALLVPERHDRSHWWPQLRARDLR